jgi:glycosidase
MNYTWHDSVFYHIYPLGLCGAPATNDRTSAPENRLKQLHPWIEHFTSLGANALYLGPVFESLTHGYDTVDLYTVDRRLGSHEDLSELVARCHEAGARVLLDGVFNHVGRDFPMFKDVVEHGQDSAYAPWFSGLRFDRSSPAGDPFIYDCWDGHYSLPKLNTENPDVQQYLFEAIRQWIERYGIDGLRLDAAEQLDPAFLRRLANHCRGLREDFALLGEMVHGDYRDLANAEMLDSVTNYECYKGLYSSHNDSNYFEIAYSLNRQFGPEGIYRDIPLYNFVDNHDVSRIAEQLENPAHLPNTYLLLYTIPGVPSVYYGSEWGIPGSAGEDQSDEALRPAIDLQQAKSLPFHPQLEEVISQLGSIRHASDALRRGSYRQLHVDHQQLAFLRRFGSEVAVVAVNAAEEPVSLDLLIPDITNGVLCDRLDGGTSFSVSAGRVRVDRIPPRWGRVLTLR